jgi:aspartyl-tRNA(Asn)/glutamyl-tRNA(Gln) amidotransferase subunit C
MKLTTDQVKYVAKLANLPISEKEEKLYAEQLSKILDYVDQLNSVDTSKVEPTFNVTGKSSVWREDEVGESLTQTEALKNAPKAKNGFFVAKGVFESE